MEEGKSPPPTAHLANGEISLPVPELGLSELWDSFSLPARDPCKSITFAECLPLIMTSFPFHYSTSFDPAAGALLCGFLQLSDAPRPNPPDGTGKRAVFHPPSSPSILFGVLLPHDHDSSPDA